MSAIRILARAMTQAALAAGAACMLTLGGGCSNAVYFYETDKISFTAEGRPDATSPVSANLGIKQRVALVVPGGDPAQRTGVDPQYKPQAPVSTTPAPGADVAPHAPDTAPPNGPLSVPDNAQVQTGAESRRDAVNVISYFNFSKEPPRPGTPWKDDRFVIESAFVTGRAASELSGEEAANAAVAITGRPTLTATDYAAFYRLYRILKSDDSRTDSEEKLLTALDDLDRTVPQVYPVSVFVVTTMPGPDGANVQAIRVDHAADSPVRTDADSVGYVLVNAYLAELNASAERLKDVLTPKGDAPLAVYRLAPDANPPVARKLGSDEVKMLRSELAETRTEIRRMEQAIVTSGPARDLAQYFVNRLQGR